jgi:hypothetical protein
MELVKELGSRSWINGAGKKDSRKFGLFLCPVCKIEIEKSMSHGKRDKNCGSKECRKATFEPNKKEAIINGVVVNTTGKFKHGYSRDSDFKTFERIHASMKQRCYNPNDARFSSYGGSGIIVYEPWHDMAQFAIDMFPAYKEMCNNWDGTTSGRPSIDRIDPFGNYEPSNCEWIRYGDNSVKDKTIPVVRMDFDGNILETYPSMTDAAKFKSVYGCRTMNASIANISECCKGIISEHVGYKWEYATSKTSMQKHSVTN